MSLNFIIISWAVTDVLVEVHVHYGLNAEEQVTLWRDLNRLFPRYGVV